MDWLLVFGKPPACLDLDFHIIWISLSPHQPYTKARITDKTNEHTYIDKKCSEEDIRRNLIRMTIRTHESKVIT